LRAGPYHLTLGLCGFTASNWGAALGFDLLLPRGAVLGANAEKVLTALAKRWSATVDTLVEDTKVERAAVLEALQQACQQGKVAWDLAAGCFRIRPLTDQALDLL